LNASNKFQFLYTFGDKRRNARSANQDRAPESVFRQTGYGIGSFNVKHTLVATDKLVFDTLVQYQDGGFNLTEQEGGRDIQRLVNRETDFVSRGLFSNASNIVRPTTEVKTDSSYFFSNLLGGDHTTKFGVRYRNTPWETNTYWTGGAEARISNNFGLRPDGSLGPDRARLYRPGSNPTGLYTVGTYLQDNYSKGRLRLNLGVRWDYQNDEAKAGCVDANPIIPDLLPAQCFEGADRNVNFSDISPRISATYDLLGTGKTVLKGGYAQYYGQGVGLAGALNLIGSVTVTFQNSNSRTCWSDANGDYVVQRDELNLACIQYPGTFDPETGLREQTENQVDPNLKNDRTQEFTGGIEHELLPNFAVGVNYIHRNYDRFRSSIRIGETKDMWVAREWTDVDAIAEGLEPPSEFGLPSGGWIYYEFNPNLVRPPGVTLTQNVAETRIYNGVDLTLTKRFSDRWMLNGALTVQRRIDDPDFCFDCTNLDKRFGINNQTLWILKMSGMYALPKGFNVSANLQMQQGQNRTIAFDGPPDNFRSGGISSFSGNPLTLGDVRLNAYTVGTFREPTVHLLDAQVTKTFDMRGGKNRLSLIASVFNVLNANTVRGYNNNLNSSNYDNVTSILSPRVARIQASITF
jgi:hypothetical protein